jgi:hypothetical protein
VQTGQGGHDVLDHLDGRMTFADRGAALGGNDISDTCRHSRPIGQIAALEYDAGVVCGWVELDNDICTVEEPNPAHFRDPGEGALWTGRFQHRATPSDHPDPRLHASAGRVDRTSINTNALAIASHRGELHSFVARARP